jgi:rhamnulokinase
VDKARRFLGIDLGASSGRAVLGTLADGRLALDEIQRFPNAPVPLGGTLYWDFLGIWKNILDALRAGARASPGALAGIGVDAWGIDFGLLGERGELLGNPVCYRDARTEGMDSVLREVMGDEEIYRLTGMTPARIATLPQLLAAARTIPATLAAARTMLFMSDLVRRYLCGARSTERTIIGSSLLSDVRTGGWCDRILDAFAVPRVILPPIAELGTVAGTLLPEVCSETGLAPAPVMVTAGHDTLAAAAAVPSAGPDELFISSGTWSVLGLVRDAPLTSPAALSGGLVNELGVGCVVLAKNLMGFHLLENLRQEWVREGHPGEWDGIVKAAGEAPAFHVFLDPEHPAFFVPGRTGAAVRDYLRATGQADDPGWGTVARAQYEGLAFSFRRAVAAFEKATGRAIAAVSIVGGGSRNTLFCQMIADATGREVRAGPAEATVIGNIGVQAVAAGALAGPADIRRVSARSFPPVIFEPRRTGAWDRANARFADISDLAHRSGPGSA